MGPVSDLVTHGGSPILALDGKSISAAVYANNWRCPISILVTSSVFLSLDFQLESE